MEELTINEIVEGLYPSVQRSTFGQKMFNRITPLLEELCDSNQSKIFTEVVKHLRYQAGCSQEQQMVFTYFADLAESCVVKKGRRPKNYKPAKNWRDFMVVWANVSQKLPKKNLKDFFRSFPG